MICATSSLEGAGRRELLAAAVEALGASSRDLAAMLGAYHPDGPRDSIDDSDVRKWLRGARAPHDWIGPALAALCDDRAEPLKSASAKIRKHW